MTTSRRKFNLNALALLGTASLPAGASLAAEATDEPTPARAVFALPYNPVAFIPILQSGYVTGQVGPQLFASPLRYDSTWKPQPYLAQAWHFSDDGLTFTMELVDNARFHDGEPITADDVAFSVTAARQYHPFNTLFAPISSVDAPDSHTVVIQLAHQHPVLELAMSPVFMPVLPRHVYGDATDLRTHPRSMKDVVGSGPFRLEEFRSDQWLRLRRFEHFFLPQRPRLDELIYQVIQDPTATLLSLRRGEVQYDSYTSVPLREISNLKEQQKELTVTDSGYAGIGGVNWLAFNTAREPLDDVRVRHAIAYGIDKRFIIDKMQYGLSRRAVGPISDESPFFAQGLPAFEHDPARAAALLDEAGFPLRKGKRDLQLRVDWIPGSVEFGKNVAEAIKSQLGRLGITITVRTFPDFASWNTAVSTDGNYDLSVESVFNWGDPVIGVHRTYSSSNIKPGVPFSNTSRYSNPRVDELLNQAAQELNTARRTDLYREFQELVVNDMPLHYLHTMPYYTIHDPRLEGLPNGIWGSMAPLDQVSWR